jgi:hypothetical protein
MVVMAVAMTVAMAVARRWRRAAFIVIWDIKGVKWRNAPEGKLPVHDCHFVCYYSGAL